MKISRLSILCLLGLAIAGGWWWQKNSTHLKKTTDILPATTQQNIVVPLETEFSELTIPYLRQKSYQSQLGELTQIAKNSNYTSYTTNYSSDGLRINGLLTIPSGEQPPQGWPAIVFVHGYIPPTLYKTQEKYVEYVAALARSGFVVFKIDLRGHGTSEGTPTGAYYSSGYVIDTLHAVAALQNADFVAADRIGLWGHSMAGNVVLRSLAAKPDIKAAVIWAGAGYTYQDLRTYGLDDNSYRPPTTSSPAGSMRQKLFATHGQFDPDSEFWRQIVPTNYLSDFKTAIQLHHAVDDTVVNSKYSEDLAALLTTHNITHQLHTYQTGGHNISGAAFTTAMRRTIEFYQIYLSTN
jgi:uncharacterized protein